MCILQQCVQAALFPEPLLPLLPALAHVSSLRLSPDVSPKRTPCSTWLRPTEPPYTSMALGQGHRSKLPQLLQGALVPCARAGGL